MTWSGKAVDEQQDKNFVHTL